VKRDVGEVSWDILAIQLREQRDRARREAVYWQHRYESLAAAHQPGPEASEWPGCHD
jgi:hypothetical protein